ncbi:hypothetical protein [Methylobacterium sp. P5_C11]
MSDIADQPKADTELALDMIGRAYLALAILFETAHPGEFEKVQTKIHAFVEANLRLIAETNDRTIESGPEGVAARVNGILTDIEREVGAMIRPRGKPGP